MLAHFAWGAAVAALQAAMPLCASGQWQQVVTGTSLSIRDASFASPDQGFCVAGDPYWTTQTGEAVIMRTTDGGGSWTVILSDSVAFSAVVAANDTVCAFGRGAYYLMFRSFDQGGTWQKDTVEFEVAFRERPVAHAGAIYFIDGLDDKLKRLNPGNGQIDVLTQYTSLFTWSSERLYVLDLGSDSIRWSLNSGATWQAIGFDTSNAINTNSMLLADMFVSGDTIIVKGAYPGAVVYTLDHGGIWNWHYTNDALTTITSGNRLYQALDSIYVSNDRGVTSIGQVPVSGTMRGILFMDASTGFVWGDSGTMYKTTTGGFPLGVGQPMVRDELGITVRPNPAMHQINLVVPIALRVDSIELMDTAAKRLREYPPNQRSLDVQGFAPGQYVLKLTTDRGVQSIKLNLQ